MRLAYSATQKFELAGDLRGAPSTDLMDAATPHLPDTMVN
jgi:hypothetical protein